MSDKKWTPIICVDFDGVLHSYTSGWKGAGVIPDPPVEGTMEWLANAVLSDKAQIAIYSSRSKDADGIPAMRRWLAAHLTLYFTMSIEKLREIIFHTYPKLQEWGHFEQGDEDAHLKLAKLVLDKIQFPTEKPAAIMTIDDRAHCFMGRFRPIDWYLNFKPWNKRSPEPDVPDYDKDWNQDDEDLADQTLECLLDCLTVNRDGFFMFEGSALEYMASMFAAARRNAAKEGWDGPSSVGDLRETLFEVLSTKCSSKCLDDEDDRDAVLEEVLNALLTKRKK
jgi:hypothetical protein